MKFTHGLDQVFVEIEPRSLFNVVSALNTAAAAATFAGGSRCSCFSNPVTFRRWTHESLSVSVAVTVITIKHEPNVHRGMPILARISLSLSRFFIHAKHRFHSPCSR